MANATERNMLLTATVPMAQRVISKAKDARAGVKASLKTSDLFIRAQQAATRILSKAIDRNFLGKGFASGLYITPVGARAVNFAGYLVGKHLNLMKTGSLTQRAVSAVLATSYFTWLRVLSAEDFLPGGGGKEGLEKEAEAAQSTADSIKPVATTVATATEYVESAVKEREPVPLPGELTAALNKAEEEAPEETKPIVKAAREAAEEASKGPEEAKKAKKNLANTIDRAAAAAKKKYEETVNKSPKIADLPSNSQKEAKNNSKKADENLDKPGASKGTRKGAAKSGDTGAGKGGGKGGGDGTGTGTGTGKGFGPGSATNVVYARIKDAVKNNKYESVESVMDKEVFEKLKKFGNTRVYLKVRNKINYLKRKVTLDDFKNEPFEQMEESINNLADYREKVLNERFDKLVKGFVK
jgi:hypothetical protein